MTLKTLIASTLCLGLLCAACDSNEPAKSDSASAEQGDKASSLKDSADESSKNEAAKDEHDAFTNHSPDDVEKLLGDKKCVPVDANGASTREKYGTLPGAVLLTGADYDVSELPDDKASKLVFYCGGQQCMAAPKAAKVAKAAGYSDVAVMRAGIRGWVDAGKQTDKPSS